MIEKLMAMRLPAMVDGLRAQQQDSTVQELSFLERLELLVDQQWNWRENQALARRMKMAIQPVKVNTNYLDRSLHVRQ